MKTFLIQRNLPGAGNLTLAERKAIAIKSCAVINELGRENIQWLYSYVTSDNLWCTYRAENEEFIREHAKKGSFPCDNIREVFSTFSPETSEVVI